MNVKAGDKVIIHNSYGDCVETVEKITPTGRIKVGSTYYTPKGQQIGGNGWNFKRLLEATPERIKAIEEKSLIGKAVRLFEETKTLTVEQARAVIAVLTKRPFEPQEKEACEYCDKKERGFKPINDTMKYSGIEIAMSPLGVLRVRHYPISDYDCGFDTQDVVNINVCPKCGRELREMEAGN